VFLLTFSIPLAGEVNDSHNNAVGPDALEKHLRLSGHIHSNEGDEYEAQVQLDRRK
jgi:hypothetical protein